MTKKGATIPETVAVSKLRGYDKNSRTHSDEQLSQLAASISEFGFVNPVLVDENYVVIAGHGRLMAAKRLGLSEIPCIVISHLSDAQKRAYVIADNKIAERGGWDIGLLRQEVLELMELGADHESVGFSTQELDDLLRQKPELPQRVEMLKPVKFTRMLVSIPVTVSDQEFIREFADEVVLAGGRIDYAGN